ncbi:unnamed protein product [Symbiodinium pilosum]|uniref:Uncharacterized protein n=1 Tax=Symbiodinium pilosum TaxID=2952 RepID=A0A812KSL8_SYMPI|nr:unnamed protein product [Symbiodinium pilosum]
MCIEVATYELLRSASVGQQASAAKADAAEVRQGVDDDIPSEVADRPPERLCLPVARLSCRPPLRLAETALSEVVLPGAQLDYDW